MTPVETAYRLLNAGGVRQAIACLQRGAAAGDPASLLELGIWQLEGRHLRRDLPSARECFRRAGELGDVAAEHVYICFLANGVGGDADWQAAMERLRKLAATDRQAARQIEIVDAMAIDDQGSPRTRPVGERLSTRPEVWAFADFASADECNYLVETAETRLEPSVVVDPASGQLRPNPIRTSHGAVFPWAAEDLVVSALNRRIASASGTSAQCGEPLQVLRYQAGQEYRPHVDALPPGDNQRILTMLVYLNGGYRGGETLFTETELSFSGKQGDGLLFRNAAPEGLPDALSKHAGLPVLEGEKYIASRWIRAHPIRVS